MLLLGIYLFAVLGLQSFRGNLYACNDPLVHTAAECIGDFNVTSVEEFCSFLPTHEEQEVCELSSVGVPFPRVWAAAPENFDNLGNALLTVFEIVTGG